MAAICPMPVKKELNWTFKKPFAVLIHSSAIDTYSAGKDAESSGLGSVCDGSSNHQDTGLESTSSNHREDGALVTFSTQKENRNVFRSKALVFTVLIIAAVFAGGLTYHFLSQEEVNDFHTQVCTIDNDCL
jgi:hypothetical protein